MNEYMVRSLPRGGIFPPFAHIPPVSLPLSVCLCVCVVYVCVYLPPSLLVCVCVLYVRVLSLSLSACVCVCVLYVRVLSLSLSLCRYRMGGAKGVSDGSIGRITYEEARTTPVAQLSAFLRTQVRLKETHTHTR